VLADGGAGSVADMNRLVLSLWLVAAAYPGHTPNLLQTKREAPASAGQLAEIGATSDISSPASLRPMTEPRTPAIQSVALRSPTTMLDDAQSVTPPRADNRIGKPPTPLPSTGDTSEDEEANWVVVIRGATVHSGPSVSAPTVRFYPVGTELRLIGYQQGWFQVSNPATSQRGWIYETYYLQSVRGPGQTIATASNSPRFEAPKPSPPVRRVKKPRPRQDERIQPRIANVRIQNESVASLVERAFRGY
jgi:hypothetical protein